jgi:uncharacterized protein YkwD
MLTTISLLLLGTFTATTTQEPSAFAVDYLNFAGNSSLALTANVSPSLTTILASSAGAATSSATGSVPSQTGDGGVDIAAILDQHNIHRQNASVPALVWSTDMASIAAEIASSCVYAHNT